MTTNAPPSRDPANDDSLVGTFKLILRKMIQNTDDMLPAIVESHDRAKNRVKVRPVITMIDTNGQIVRRDTVEEVPVINLGGGGFFINFNLPPGSLGWIKANDRDISLFLQSYRESKPNTKRMHSFSDALFIPDVMSGYQIDDEDSEAMVIQNLDGSVKIAMDDSGIRMKGPTANLEFNELNIECDVMGVNCNTLNVVATSGATINDVTIMPGGNIQTGGNLTSAGATVGGLDFGSHRHTDGTAPDGNTGGPIS